MQSVIQRANKKNHYLLQTLCEEVNRYKVVSFDIFDTLILRRVLFPQDIYKILSEKVLERFQIRDFLYIRVNIEQEVRNNSVEDEISIFQIYEEIHKKHSQIDCNQILNMELELELQNAVINPFVMEIYQAALKSNAEIWLLSDTYLPYETVEQILKSNKIQDYQKLYLSNCEKAGKYSGNMYHKILDSTGVKAKEWLHMGDNWENDVLVPRSFGITSCYIKSPKDWFFIESEERHRQAEQEAGYTVPKEKWDDSIGFSCTKAIEINDIYTQHTFQEKDATIIVDNVSIMFNMAEEKVDNIKEYVIRILKHQLKFQEFWALKNINFIVRRGEKLGLVGLNGSGKSTMLKIISEVLKPTEGKVTVIGSIAPLIELGAGFDMELSAKENIFLNGAILGYSKKEMESFYDYIIEFSELKEFENVAVKNFSSGMIARLGFAIATCHKPDILIIDEILAVGDYEFQKKCHKRMSELTTEGTTVLFVSHSAGDIIDMCDRVIWLEHGQLVQQGEAQYIVEKYLG